MNKRMNRDKLHIGTYILQPYAQSERHIRELAECGIDLAFCMDYRREALDLLHKYGVGAVVSGVVPGWFGGTGENAGKLAEENPLKLYEEAAKGFADHPAIWGIDIGDEPSMLDFPHYGKIAETVARAFPEQFPYLNLYPSYGMLASAPPEQAQRELGTASYAEYLKSYCENVKTDYLSFDHYVYSSNPERLISDLSAAASICRETGRGLWVVLQVNSLLPEIFQSENRLRFQAYSALAFGTECITWACYTAGWWHNQVLDERGEKTPQYERLKKVNHEIKAIAEEYRKYRRVKTDIADSREICADGLSVRTADGSKLLAGQFKSASGDGAKALVLCSAADPLDENPHEVMIELKAAGDNPLCGKSLIFRSGESITKLTAENGIYKIKIPTCGGGILTIE